jgi:uncharacterized protein
MTKRTEISRAPEYDGHTELMRAALEGRIAAVRRLLWEGADVNAKDSEGRTALMFAAVNGHTKSVKALLEHGADVNAKDNDGCTALILASSSGAVDIVRNLLSRGADLSGRVAQTGKTALALAEENNHREVAELLRAAEGERSVEDHDLRSTRNDHGESKEATLARKQETARRGR